MSRMPALEELRRPAYPRSAQYDLQWQVDLCMGPNPLWLLEDLLRDVDLRPGMRVLDLACGLGMSSIYLAREYDVQVVAADLWISAADNQRRFDEAELGHRIEAVDAEAHALPFDEAEFDAVISIGAYHYFGTDDLYIGYISQFLKPGGLLAIAGPGSLVESRELGGYRTTSGS
jgi:cyclopropane fatty-acyl-phospholipid synthase-like methyltransferase